MALDGRIGSDGLAAFYGEVIVGSSLTGLGAARGTPSDFRALARFDGAAGSGKRDRRKRLHAHLREGISANKSYR